MKKLVIIAICLGSVLGAAAQRGHSIGVYHGGYALRPRVGIGIGFNSPFYSPFGYYGYPFGFPYGYYPYGAYGSAYNRQSKLERKKEDIRMDYADRIYSVKHDRSLTSKEKRQKIRSLKQDRKKDIRELIETYHRRPQKSSDANENSQRNGNS